MIRVFCWELPTMSFLKCHVSLTLASASLDMQLTKLICAECLAT